MRRRIAYVMLLALILAATTGALLSQGWDHLDCNSGGDGRYTGLYKDDAGFDHDITGQEDVPGLWYLWDFGYNSENGMFGPGPTHIAMGRPLSAGGTGAHYWGPSMEEVAEHLGYDYHSEHHYLMFQRLLWDCGLNEW